MKKKINEILKKVLQKINCEDKNLLIKKELRIFLQTIKKEISSKKIQAEVFVGGSFAKSTVINKKIHDIDVFIRFSNKYEEKDFQHLTKNILSKYKDIKMVHGSRDYYQLKVNDFLVIEIVPVLKVNNPKQARNITDLSYSHVRYVRSKTNSLAPYSKRNKKIKSKKALDEIKLAKAFCEAKGVYGAESYIKGFSGYSLELLIIHYKTFMNFLKKISEAGKDKIIIDIEKNYKNKNQILMDLNESKLGSPIILIDPTYKQRNALAALSEESFRKFQEDAKKFIKNPSEKDFEIQKIDLEKIKKQAQKKKLEFSLIEIKTNKQEGDIAGSKLLKFYNHFTKETTPFFEIKDRGFNYNNKKSSRFFFVAKAKKEIISEGPLLKDKKNVIRFKKAHKKTFNKNGKIFAKQNINFSLNQFVNHWKKKNSRKLKEMDIIDLKVVD